MRENVIHMQFRFYESMNYKIKTCIQEKKISEKNREFSVNNYSFCIQVSIHQDVQALDKTLIQRSSFVLGLFDRWQHHLPYLIVLYYIILEQYDTSTPILIDTFSLQSEQPQNQLPQGPSNPINPIRLHILVKFIVSVTA